MRVRRNRIYGFLFTVTLLAIWVVTDTTSARPQSGNRILLNVVALDDHNQPVRDLTIQDFRVTDEGKNQLIVAFSHNQDTGKTPPAILLLFDLLNANQLGVNLAENEIIQSLEHSEIADSIYLYLLANNGNVIPIHPLPDNPLETSPNVPWTQQLRPVLEKTVNQVIGLRPMSEQNGLVRFDTTFRALEALGSQLARLPGHRSMVWITHGIASGDSRRLRQFAEQLNQNGITLSSVERGDQPSSYDIETLRQLADLTGGTVYDANLDKILAEVATASRFSYHLEYAAPASDGKYHKIRVTCSRKGVRIQTRQGYYSN